MPCHAVTTPLACQERALPTGSLRPAQLRPLPIVQAWRPPPHRTRAPSRTISPFGHARRQTRPSATADWTVRRCCRRCLRPLQCPRPIPSLLLALVTSMHSPMASAAPSSPPRARPRLHGGFRPWHRCPAMKADPQPRLSSPLALPTSQLTPGARKRSLEPLLPQLWQWAPTLCPSSSSPLWRSPGQTNLTAALPATSWFSPTHQKLESPPRVTTKHSAAPTAAHLGGRRARGAVATDDDAGVATTSPSPPTGSTQRPSSSRAGDMHRLQRANGSGATTNTSAWAPGRSSTGRQATGYAGDPKLLADLMQVLHRRVELQDNVEHSWDRLAGTASVLSAANHPPREQRQESVQRPESAPVADAGNFWQPILVVALQ